MVNLCGKCNVCCTQYRVDKNEVFWKDEDRADGQTCEMLAEGQCSVYNKRPNACITFECLWLQLSKLIDDFPDEFRPDNLKLVVAVSHNKKTSKVDFKIRELEEDILNFDSIDAVLNRFLQIVFKVAAQQKMDSQVIIESFGRDTTNLLKQSIGR